MIRLAGAIKRFHTVSIIGQQTVAEHSFYVALLCSELTGGNPSSELLKAALHHDLAEICTGDIPAPVKWKNPKLKCELANIERVFEIIHGIDSFLTNEEEKLILKYADSLECAFFAVDQIMLGNKNMIRVYDNIISHLMTLQILKIPKYYDAIFETLKEEYYDAIK